MPPVAEFDPGFFEGVLGKRALAWIMDSIAILGLVVLVLPLTLFSGVLFLPVLYLFLGLIYRWVTVARIGATPGMWLLGLELRRRDGARLDPALAFQHALGFTISFTVFPLQLLSIGLMLTSDHKTGLSDILLGTVAINRPMSRSGKF